MHTAQTQTDAPQQAQAKCEGGVAFPGGTGCSHQRPPDTVWLVRET